MVDTHFIHEDFISTDPVSYLSRNGVEVQMLRLDKIHPVVSGNKWYKLRFHIAAAQQQQKSTIVTFGGAYSNHIVATAAACAACGCKSIGIIRGEVPSNYAHTLQAAQSYGMGFLFLSREDFSDKRLPLHFMKPDYYVIPEGGYSSLGADGAATIPIPTATFDHVCCAVGTGTMMSGLMNAKPQNGKVVGFSVLKNNFSIESEIRALLHDAHQEIVLHHHFHCGGYAKHTPELLQFMNELFAADGIPTDFVYTAKICWAVKKMVEKHYFANGEKLLLIHSGGLQGNLSLRKGSLIF